MVGPFYRCVSDGYVLDFYLGLIVPVPVYRIDEQGNRIPMTVEEIIEWQEEYRRSHPEIELFYQEREEEKRKSAIARAAINAKIEKKVTWWNNHPRLKTLCKPFLPSYYKFYGF